MEIIEIFLNEYDLIIKSEVVYLPAAKQTKKVLTKYGVAKKTAPQETTIIIKKNEKTESINSFCSFTVLSILSDKNGIKTEIETKEATETNMRSGILKAA